MPHPVPHQGLLREEPRLPHEDGGVGGHGQMIDVVTSAMLGPPHRRRGAHRRAVVGSVVLVAVGHQAVQEFGAQHVCAARLGARIHDKSCALAICGARVHRRHEDGGDEVATYDEKDVNTKVPSWKQVWPQVEYYDANDS